MATTAGATGPRLLRQYLEDTATSQKVFGEQVGVCKAHVCGMVSGKTHPSLDLALRIEKATKKRVPVSAWSKPSSRRSRAA